MIHTKAVFPRIFGRGGSRTPAQIDRAQTLDGDLALSKEKLYEIGRENLLGYRKGTPKFSYSMKQNEYGNMAFFRDLANKVDPSSTGGDNSVELDELSTTRVDIAAFATDDTDVFEGTLWFPNLRVSGLTINIGSPDAVIERNFSLVGEAYNFLDDNYFAYNQSTSGIGNRVIVLDPTPVEWRDGDYVFTVLRVRSGALTVLDEGAGINQWSFAAIANLTVNDCEDSDIVKVFYESASAYTTLWTDNDTADEIALYAECCEIYMKVGDSTKIYRLQSVGIDCSFERADWKEIGNSEVVQTGIKSKTVTVNLNRYAEDMSLEKILSGDSIYPFFDPTAFVDNIQLMIKIFSDKTHDTFKIGYLITDLSPTKLGVSNAVQDYQQRTNTLESDNLLVSDDEAEIVFA